MICKVCNANIDDNAAVCPFCGTDVTNVSVDPGLSAAPETPAFPDPASASFNTPSENSIPDPASTGFNTPFENSIPDPVPAAPVDPQPSFNDPQPTPVDPAADLGLSEPAAPFTDPMASAPQSADPYMDPAGAIPNGQPVQPNFSQNNMNGGFTQNDFSQPGGNFGQPSTPPPTGGYNSFPDPTSDLEKEAGTVQTLGIVALVLSLVIGFCCCAIAGPGVGIAGLVKFNKLKDSLYLLSPEGQKKANTGRTLSIIAIVLGGLAVLSNIILMSTGALEEIANEM